MTTRRVSLPVMVCLPDSGFAFLGDIRFITPDKGGGAIIYYSGGGQKVLSKRDATILIEVCQGYCDGQEERWGLSPLARTSPELARELASQPDDAVPGSGDVTKLDGPFTDS